MRELIADLRTIASEDNVNGEELVDHGIVQQLENVLLDYTGKVIRIRITEVARQKAINLTHNYNQ